MEYVHVPVLLKEVLSGLNPQPGQHFIDGTVGGGGHAHAVLTCTAPHGRLLALDRDEQALTAARKHLASFGTRVEFVHASYAELAGHAERLGFGPVQGVLLDLGLSSAQLSDVSRGFSFQGEGELDLRFDTTQGEPAYHILQTYTAEELEAMFRQYGEEPRARALARAIVAARRQHPFRTTTDLLAVVARVKGSSRRSLHPATLVWQALRMAVNDELGHLEQGLKKSLEVTVPGGRLAVISFHSGEDRVVKTFFRREARDCVCPPELPTCQCNHHARLKLITRKPIVAGSSELSSNSRARSAKLRLAEVIA